MKKHMSRLLLAAVSAAFPALLPAAPAAQKPKMPQPVVSVGTVVRHYDVEQRNCTGLVVSPSVVQMVPRVSGEILEIGFKDGAAVVKGQMLYRLKDVKYAAAVKAARATVKESTAKRDYAQNNFVRKNELYQKKATSLDTLEIVRSERDVLEAALQAAEASLMSAEEDLLNCRIVSPINAVAGPTNFSVGNYLTPSSGTLVTLIQTDPIRVRFSLSMRDYLSMFRSFDELKKNGSVKLTLPDGTVFDEPGAIELMNNSANRNTDTVQLYALFSNKKNLLVPNSTVTVTLTRKGSKLRPAVPMQAVLHDARGAYVFCVNGQNAVNKQYIEVGNAFEGVQIVLSGLNVGDKVVVEGIHKVVSGMTVRTAPDQK